MKRNWVYVISVILAIMINIAIYFSIKSYLYHHLSTVESFYYFYQSTHSSSKDVYYNAYHFFSNLSSYSVLLIPLLTVYLFTFIELKVKERDFKQYPNIIENYKVNLSFRRFSLSSLISLIITFIQFNTYPEEKMEGFVYFIIYLLFFVFYYVNKKQSHQVIHEMERLKDDNFLGNDMPFYSNKQKHIFKLLNPISVFISLILFVSLFFQLKQDLKYLELPKEIAIIENATLDNIRLLCYDNNEKELFCSQPVKDILNQYQVIKIEFIIKDNEIITQLNEIDVYFDVIYNHRDKHDITTFDSRIVNDALHYTIDFTNYANQPIKTASQNYFERTFNDSFLRIKIINQKTHESINIPYKDISYKITLEKVNE